jgi:hypothetical protein
VGGASSWRSEETGRVAVSLEDEPASPQAVENPLQMAGEDAQ